MYFHINLYIYSELSSSSYLTRYELSLDIGAYRGISGQSNQETDRKITRRDSSTAFTGPEYYCEVTKSTMKIIKKCYNWWTNSPGERDRQKQLAKLTSNLLSLDRKIVKIKTDMFT